MGLRRFIVVRIWVNNKSSLKFKQGQGADPVSRLIGNREFPTRDPHEHVDQNFADRPSWAIFATVSLVQKVLKSSSRTRYFTYRILAPLSGYTEFAAGHDDIHRQERFLLQKPFTQHDLVRKVHEALESDRVPALSS